jgi:hypothetical protein
MSDNVYLWASFGQLGQVADPVTGIRQLVARAKAIGVNVMESPYQWFDANKIAAEVVQIKKKDLDGKIIVGGASLGDNEAVEIANLLNGKCDIDLLFGFQRSRFGRQFQVPANVLKALEIHDPNILSDPFGDDPWVRAAGNQRTLLRNIAIDALHPGDFGPGQDIVFNAIKVLAQPAEA